MNLHDAERLAVDLMRQHGVGHWGFRWDRAKQHFGTCRYRECVITLSMHLVRLNEEPRVRQTILHEIAHALTPGAHHGWRWQQKARELGIPADRCFTSENTALPEGRYTGTCPACQRTVPKHKRPTRVLACTPCCKAHARGKFDARFAFKWTETRTGIEVAIQPRMRQMCKETTIDEMFGPSMRQLFGL